MNHAYCLGLNPGWKKMRFQLPLNKTFCPYPQSLTHRQVKQRQRTKFNKTMLSAPSLPPHRFSTQSLQYQNWNVQEYSILTVNELGPPALESSARISKSYAPTDSEQKFNKTEIIIGYPQDTIWDRLGWKPAVITATLCSSANRESHQFLYNHP